MTTGTNHDQMLIHDAPEMRKRNSSAGNTKQLENVAINAALPLEAAA